MSIIVPGQFNASNLNSSTYVAGGDELSVHNFASEAVFKISERLKLVRVRYYEAHTPSKMPSFTDFGPEILSGLRMQDNFSLTCVQALNAKAFEIEHVGAANRMRSSEWFGRRLFGDLPPLLQAEFNPSYTTAKIGRPIFKRVDARVDGRAFSYLRDLLPLSENGVDVTHVLTVFEPLDVLKTA